MGLSISDSVAEIFSQYFEHLVIKYNIDIKSLVFYTGHVNDILIIYDCTKTTHTQILNFANSLHNNLQFSLTQETDANNILEHLLTHRTTQGLEIEIYRKPTSNVPVIHFTSNQPTEHKTEACRFSLTRIHPLPLIPRNKQKEHNAIIYISKTN
jgi:hypothetical protein